MKKIVIVFSIICFCAAALFVHADGGLDEPCIDGYLCEEGLTCVNNVCVPGGVDNTGPAYLIKCGRFLCNYKEKLCKSENQHPCTESRCPTHNLN